MLIAQVIVVAALFVVFLVVWYRTEDKRWRALVGGLLALSVIALTVSAFFT